MPSYGSIEGVSALVPSMGDINTTSTPTDNEVSQWLDQGYSIINRVLSTYGYSVPIASTADIYDELIGLNNLYVHSKILTVRGLDIMQGEDQDRSKTLMMQFKDELFDLAKSDLSLLGVTVNTSVSHRRKRVRSLQLRRIDGYSGEFEDAYDEYDYVSD